ncbi:hypothetical protein B0T20DRAFT_396662 [Sordaria brevicollis]|uniref:Uncharacterized protein n=1 Tax=Sordaria brevicollis TaxID=83679 RepID=A0AAE0P288_SORBR|nr:hypothetical protein B0T20DRAFT_396662 [Sordaria brevicollis]
MNNHPNNHNPPREKGSSNLTGSSPPPPPPQRHPLPSQSQMRHRMPSNADSYDNLRQQHPDRLRRKVLEELYSHEKEHQLTLQQILQRAQQRKQHQQEHPESLFLAAQKDLKKLEQQQQQQQQLSTNERRYKSPNRPPSSTGGGPRRGARPQQQAQYAQEPLLLPPPSRTTTTNGLLFPVPSFSSSGSGSGSGSLTTLPPLRPSASSGGGVFSSLQTFVLTGRYVSEDDGYWYNPDLDTGRRECGCGKWGSCSEASGSGTSRWDEADAGSGNKRMRRS